MSKLLALDQASRITGYAIFEDGNLKAYGKITADQEDVGVRLVYIRNEVLKLIEKYHIDEVIMEDIQLQNNVGNNVQTFKVLAEVFGVLYELFTELKIPNSAVLASTWKSALSIKGRVRADQKKNAQIFIQNTYHIKPTQDECDAICIGYYKIKNLITDDSGFDWSE